MDEIGALLNKEEIRECAFFRQQFELRRTKLEKLIDRRYGGDRRIEMIKRLKLKKLHGSILEEYVAFGKIERIIIKQPHSNVSEASNRKDRVTIRYVNPELPQDFWLDDKTVLTKLEASKLLSVSRSTLDKWVECFNFPTEVGANRGGKSFKKSAIREWLTANKTFNRSSKTGFCVRNYFKFRQPRDVGNTCYELVLLNRRSECLHSILERAIQKKKPRCIVEFMRFACPIIPQINKIADVVLTDPLCAVQFVIEMRRFGREHEIHIPQFRSKSFEDSKALYFWFKLVSCNDEDLKELTKYVNKLSWDRPEPRKIYYECIGQMHKDKLIDSLTLNRLQGTLAHIKGIDKVRPLNFDSTNDVVVDYNADCSANDQYFSDAKEMVDFWNNDNAINLSGQESVLISQIEDCNRSLSFYENRKKELENKLKELKTSFAEVREMDKRRDGSDG